MTSNGRWLQVGPIPMFYRPTPNLKTHWHTANRQWVVQKLHGRQPRQQARDRDKKKAVCDGVVVNDTPSVSITADSSMQWRRRQCRRPRDGYDKAIIRTKISVANKIDHHRFFTLITWRSSPSQSVKWWIFLTVFGFVHACDGHYWLLEIQL